MGDIIMSSPAFRALKETFHCRLTLLTSPQGSSITSFIKEIDETIVFHFPWIKTNDPVKADCEALVKKLKQYHFDAAIIFTVYSQNPLPAALIAYMANIPHRLAYCRENPYALLTHWAVDKEPYTFVCHQVERDLNLVKYIGAVTNNDRLHLNFQEDDYKNCLQKLAAQCIDMHKDYIIFHAGVSEKRQYSQALWIEAAKLLRSQTGKAILLTGSAEEKINGLYNNSRRVKNVFSIAGMLSLAEFISLIAHASLVVSVNTATVHIAAATQTPLVVLYAQTNPQHEPWKTNAVVLPFSVAHELESKNEVIQYVNKQYYTSYIPFPSPGEILLAASTVKSELFCGNISSKRNINV